MNVNDVNVMKKNISIHFGYPNFFLNFPPKNGKWSWPSVFSPDIAPGVYDQLLLGLREVPTVPNAYDFMSSSLGRILQFWISTISSTLHLIIYSK